MNNSDGSLTEHEYARKVSNYTICLHEPIKLTAETSTNQNAFESIVGQLAKTWINCIKPFTEK
jgi:hypothetical protein